MQTKKDLDRSKGKGRRICLGGRIYSIPCRTRGFASVVLEEQDDFNLCFCLNPSSMGGDYRGADAGAGNGLAPVDHLPVRLAPPQHLHTTITSYRIVKLAPVLNTVQ